MTDLFLCSFASPDLKKSSLRFLRQAEQIELYEEIKIYSWDDLSNKRKDQIRIFFKNNKKRLYGYACWKPEIILNYLNLIPPDAILQYSDIGCHINKFGKQRLKNYFEMTKKNNFLAFQYHKPNFKLNKKLKYQVYFDYEYTKSDLFNFFGIPEDSSIRNSEQIWSGSMFFKNNSKSKIFLRKWLEICEHNNLIDDSPSVHQNLKEFIEHRHDQSVFSILCKLNNVSCLSASECEWAEDENGRYWDHLKYYPILAKRDKKLSLMKRFFLRQIKNFKRIINLWKT